MNPTQKKSETGREPYFSNTQFEEIVSLESRENSCPDCGAGLYMNGRCPLCRYCGWSPCA
ncbi:hypothetical protein ACFL6B_03765 [Thermodesulfobacteriota bacterium]